MREFRDRKKIERERDLADKRDNLDEALSDVSVWEEYLLDEEVLSTFHQDLGTLETVTEQDIHLLQDQPGTETHQY